MKKMNELNVLITGGTKGIGLATAKELATNVSKLIICSRNNINILNNKKNINYYKADISQIEDVTSLKNKLINDNLQIDVLINNAGTAYFKPFLESEINEVNKLFNINFFGTINMIQAFLPGMINNKFGKIININSVLSKKIFQNNAFYAASKSALDVVSKTLRQEVRGKGVDIIDVYPGATESDMWDSSTKNERVGRMMFPEDIGFAVKEILELSLSDRMVPEEIILRPKLGDL